MRSIGIALIGYGGIGRVHAMAYRDLLFHYGLPADAVQIVGVATSRPETAERAAREVGCPVWTADYRELLRRDDVQVADICLPNVHHEAALLAAAEAGKHVYIEKPLAMDAPQAERMIAAVDAAGVKGGMTFNFRFVPAVQRAKQLLDEGFTGRIYSFYARYHRSGYISPDRPFSWRLDRDVSGGGALFDLGAHALDLILYLLGDVVAVNASLETLVKERPIRAGASERVPVKVDDLAQVQMRIDRDDAAGFAEFSRMGTGAANDLRLEVYGEHGAIKLALEEPDWLWAYDARTSGRPLGGMRGFTRIETVQRFDGAVSPDWTMPMGFVRSHAECQYQFLRALWDDRRPEPDLRAGLAVQRILAGSELSSAERRWVLGNELHE